MKELKKIRVYSAAKIVSLISGTIYLLYSILENILISINPELALGFGIPLGIAGIISATLSGIVMGGLMGAIFALLYNLYAKKFGGLKLVIE